MNEKLKKISKQELLEIMLKQSKLNDDLMQLVEKQKEEILSLQMQLNDKNIKIRKAGSLAEASFQINGVFESAQTAAQQYIDNLEDLYEKERTELRQKEEKTRQKCIDMLIEADEKCSEMLDNTRNECRRMKMIAKMDAERYWNEILIKLEDYSRSHSELKEMLAKFKRF